MSWADTNPLGLGLAVYRKCVDRRRQFDPEQKSSLGSRHPRPGRKHFLHPRRHCPQAAKSLRFKLAEMAVVVSSGQKIRQRAFDQGNARPVLSQSGLKNLFVKTARRNPADTPARRESLGDGRTVEDVAGFIDGFQWLCDLGFGSYGIRAPMRLDVLDLEVRQDRDTFMLTKGETREYVLKALVEGEWTNQYGFDLSAQEWIDFVPANHLNSTHPDAIFVQKLLIVLHNPTGRTILVGDVLKTVDGERIEKRTLSQEAISDVLRNMFQLEYSVP